MCSTAQAITPPASTLIAIDQMTPTFMSGRASMMIAGTNPHGDSVNSSSNVCMSELSTWLIGFMNDMTQYAASVMAKGSAPVLIMSLTFVSISVFVTPATMFADDETGEALSPKYIPDMRTPAVISGSTPPLLASAMKITPTVPATPNDVPSA